jgi:sigma-B regulation protein RsbU (phosphoserine phosphatase)
VRTLFSRTLPPAEALRILNDNLIARYPSGSHIAVAYCRIDTRDGSGILANGGMPFPFLIHNGVLRRLEARGVPLGLLEGIRYDELRFQMEPGDTLILASDGATDALNREGAFYDGDRFADSICRHSVKEIPELLRDAHAELREFIDGADLSDDITILALRRRK